MLGFMMEVSMKGHVWHELLVLCSLDAAQRNQGFYLICTPKTLITLRCIKATTA